MSTSTCAALAGGRGFDDRAQRVGGAPAAADHPAVVVRGDAQLEHDRAVVLLELLDRDRVGIVDQAFGEVLEQPARGALAGHRVVALRGPGASRSGVSMPWMRSSLRTVSEGWAPRASQLRARSSSITIVEGSVCAL